MAMSPRARSPGRPASVVPLWRDLDSGKTKNTDQQVALSIGAIGGVPTRDKRGNVLDALWVKYSERSVVGMLLETNDIRKILLEQIQEQLKARRDLIQEVEQNDIVCQWLMAFTKSWETEYSAQIISRFDIGQLVLSVMNEAYFEVLVLFSHSPCIQKYCGRNGTQRFFVECVKKAEAHFNNMRGVAARETVLAETRKKEIEAKLQDAIRALSPDHRNTDPVKTALKKVAEVDTANSQREIKERAGLLLVDVHTGDDAVVRLLFRHPNTRSVMCRIAGAILRKQEVCNRAGGYSAKVQRNDISQQKNTALDTFCAWILNDAAGLEELMEVLMTPSTLVHYIIDHKGAQEASDGMHYAHDPAG